MSKKERRAAQARLEERLRYWVDRMHLREWDIRIALVSPIHDAYAQVGYQLDYTQALVQVGEDVAEEDWDYEIVHELSHLLVAQLQDTFTKSLELIEGREQQELLRDRYLQLEEGLVNRLAISYTNRPAPFRVHH